MLMTCIYKKGTDTFLDVFINQILLNSCNEFQASFSVPLNPGFRGRRWFDDPVNKLV